MTRGELVCFSKEVLQKMQQCDVKPDDWRYAEMLDEYKAMTEAGIKKTAVAAILAEHYNLSERQVYNILKRMQESVNC